MKERKMMKQYTKPEFQVYAISDDLLTIVSGGVQLNENSDDIVFGWPQD